MQLMALRLAAAWHFQPLRVSGRNGLKSKLTYDMFYHVEHHLFPAVPTCRLRILARRLDQAAPEFGAQGLF